ncbi:hypothetical protein VTO42DRAFT_7829 [Malbranchea cinnamomea]
MGEVSVEQALASLSSGRLKDRIDGLEDLKHILLRNKQTTGLESLDDKGYYSIFKALFRFVSFEKSNYTRSSSRRGQSNIRLAKCATVLRITVEVSVRTIKFKTFIALIDHITETLSVPGNGLWETLGGDYTKALSTLLQYPPHVEHLSNDDWCHLIDFCLASIAPVEKQSSSELSSRSSQRLSLEPLSEARSRSNSHDPGPLQRGQHDNVDDFGCAEELEHCLRFLTAWPSAPVLEGAEKLLDGLVGYLASLNPVKCTPLSAFRALNTVLARTITDNLSLVQITMLSVISIIRKFWVSKSAALKEEMLLTLIIGKDALVSLGCSSPTESFVESLHELVEQLYRGYLRLPEKDILQLEDVTFTQHSMPLLTGAGCLYPRVAVPRSVTNWATLSIIASLSILLDSINSPSNETKQPVESPYKRPRILSRVDDFFHDASSSAGPTRICALQLLPFLFLDCQPDVDKISSLLNGLAPHILDENSLVASWTMVAISSITTCPGATSASLELLWTQVWELTCRTMSSPSTSRAACNLATVLLRSQIIHYSTVAEMIDSLLSSVELNGPANLTDSALSFWSIIMELRSKVNPAQSQDTAKHICGWMKGVWTIGSIVDRIQTAQTATFARPAQLLNLLITCTGRSFKPLSLPFFGPVTSLCRAWWRFNQNKDVLQYLLLHPKDGRIHDPGTLGTCVNRLTASTRLHPGDQIVLELLQSKVDAFTQVWRSLREDQSHHITPEVIQILSSLCVTAFAFIEIVPASLYRSRDLQTGIDKLWREICAFLARQEVGLLHACLDVVSPLILSFRPPLDSKNALLKAVCKMVEPFYAVLDTAREAERMGAQDPMEIEDRFPHRGSDVTTADLALTLNRRDDTIPVFEDHDSVVLAVTVQIALLTHWVDFENPMPDKLVEHITTLGKADILVGWHFINDFVTADPVIARATACNLLEFIGEMCLSSYELERCEASISACVDLMSCFVPLWTLNENDDLSGCALDLYDWFIDVLLGERLASSKILIRLASLLERVIKSNPTFSTDNTRPSARTSLFKILNDGDLVVKFRLSRVIPTIFDRFILKEHDAIFGDVLENLPRDPDWTEGIALRLYLLSQLASRWHTLLRRSVYHIVEAPGQVPLSAPHAKACLQNVANALGLADSKDVFRLFSSQILYTWTETQSLKTIPFHIFGYATLREFLLDIQDEAVAQTVMRVKEEDMSDISHILEIPPEDLLALSFHKSEAYSVARDITTPPSQDSDFRGAENTIKRLLGPNRFLNLVRDSFPEIVATQFRCIDQTEQMGKVFAKRPEFHGALKIWKEIEGKSSSKAMLPASQQPSFRAKYLLDELEFVCGRMDLELNKIWTPTLFCFVARSLLESIHPALGSLHACSVLRKIKVLLCCAGPVALRDYPFEMLLHALRPYTTDFHCSEDAIGLFWYLIDNGREYLSENPSFVAGLAVSSLAPLKAFLSSSQDSTTQESQFRTTLSRAQAFHGWFSAFLNEYVPADLNEATRDSLRSIIRSSQNIQPVGNANRGTYESDLLAELLQNDVSGRNLLTKPAADLVFSLLCSHFERPGDFRDDILGEDRAATKNTVSLLISLRNGSHSLEYRLWAARALGRAYASTGVISDTLLKEQRVEFVDTSNVRSDLSSKFAIIHSLCDLLLSNTCDHAGLAERTLQVIVERLSAQPDLEECFMAIPVSLMNALPWSPYQCPELPLRHLNRAPLDYSIRWNGDVTVTEWARDFCLALCNGATSDPVIGSLAAILYSMPFLATQLLPYILHDVLLSEFDGKQMVRHNVSAVFREAFQDIRDSTLQHVRLIIYCVLYLRYQQLPRESTMDERDGWLEIDFLQAATAAARCRMYKTALLFVEIHSSRTATSSRRSSISRSPPSWDLLHDIFRNIDDPDFFYGVQQDASLDSVISRLQHEGSSFKNLFFQCANFDADIKLTRTIGDLNTALVFEALNCTNLQGIASVLSGAPGAGSGKTSAFDGVLSNALYLQQWDIPVPSTSSATGNLFKALQSLNTSEDKTQLLLTLDDCFLSVLGHLSDENQSLNTLRASLRTLGLLTEIDEMLASQSINQVNEVWQRIVQRGNWLKYERFDDISQILSSHEALFSLINRKSSLKSALGLTSHHAQLLEVEAIRESLRINRDHNEQQGSLKCAMLLSKLVEPCVGLGVSIDAAATFDLANVLWDQGEMTASIGMLRRLTEQPDLEKQSIPINRAQVLARLGHHIAEAKLETPDSIIHNYFQPAVEELKGNVLGQEAGHVFHEFAYFCDQQLQNPDMLEDFRRIEQIRNRKLEEVNDLEQMMQSAEGRERDQLRIYRTRAKQWFELDDQEYQRQKASRESFIQQSLENYLMSLNSCDSYENDVLRFCALWLDNSNREIANTAVSRHISSIPSKKFATLMNQLSSRLLDVDNHFQQLLSVLIYRICVDHPYHGMYQLFASSKSKGGRDETSMSRYRAAGKLVDQVRNNPTAGPTWVAIHNTNISFVRFAMDRLEEKAKSGTKILLRKSVTGQRLEQDVARQKIPPPTLRIELRDDCDYSQLPRLIKFLPEFTVASGVSAPKIVTAVASDGKQYKQLFKGGNDDLRQDAIMEQVFEQVSDLLRYHRETQQRNLGIRTYKVLPLTANAGIIEFVQNTIPLHDYLLPAHQKHFPKDLKPSACRKYINDVQTKSVEQRVRTFRQVTDRFHPVMRYFFMEHFQNPDDWFFKRLAYTRSTAAISILGHVLGLGDRHGHNILLDTKTGEVVHIDLGVAFEQGRVLPIPEVVPFRLTRDLVDGMGITKTEGVFRRCCEFTLEALREESYSIMTILDVLRYDPLYSWTLSPVRMKKMQETQEAGAGGDALANEKRKALNEPSDADRALTVVAKKLGKTLSVAATVNQLIQQATDERNLAVLYCGWAAYA